MTSLSANTQVTREIDGWMTTLVLWAAVIACGLGLVGVVVGIVHIVAWAEPGALVPVTLDVQEAGETVQGAMPVGAPHVPDGMQVTYTRASTMVTDLSASTARTLGLAEVVRGLTWAGVAGFVARAAALLRGPGFTSSLPGLMTGAAAVLAAGSTATQYVDHLGRGALSTIVVRSGASLREAQTLQASSNATFDATGLLVAVGLVVVGLVFRRALRLQTDAARHPGEPGDEHR